MMALVACFAVAGCDDDAAEESQDDSGVSEACLDARTQPLDARADASDADVSDADPPSCPLDQKYELYYADMSSGGRSNERYELEGGIMRSRGEREGDAGSYTCMAPIPCSHPVRVDARALQAALSASGVVTAFTDTDTLLGYDAPNADGEVMVLVRADGKKIRAGSPCPVGTECTPLPADVQALRVLVGRLVGSFRDPRFTDGGIGKTCP
ncbi:MAG: hypothetical protein ABW352_09975 [Polyangiales bacterium]